MSSYNSYASSMAERKLTIDGFTGIDQTRGDHSGDYGSSPDAVNFIARDGVLSTAGGIAPFSSIVDAEDLGTPGRLFQGFFRNHDNSEFSKIVLAKGHSVYSMNDDGSWVSLGSGYHDDQWSAANYRRGTTELLILTNGSNSAQSYDGRQQALFPLYMIQGDAPIRFSMITMINERLWGGVSSEYPDRIYWSNTFDPNDWDFNYVDSENEGGGFIDVATFDGSRIRAVVSAMDDILIFKDKSLHRLSGSYPGEFMLTQVFGTDGTLAPRTIVDDGRAVYFLSSDGLVRYSGMTAVPLAQSGDKKLKDIWPRIIGDTMKNACAAIKDGIIYLAVPLDGSVINTHVIEYDTHTGIYNIVELPGVEDWLVMREGQDETLLFFSGDRVYRYGAGYTFYGDPIDAVWTSPYISCGTLSSKKQTGRIYLSVSATSLDASGAPEIRLTLLSGDKVRSKLIKLKNGLNEIRKRVKVRGRMFRFRIENVDGNPLTIHRGIEIHIEEDYD